MRLEDSRSLTSFSPKLKTGTRSAPSRIASLMNPSLRFRTRYAVPGRAESDSAAPPTTMVRHDPGPPRMMFWQDRYETEQIPRPRLADGISESRSTSARYLQYVAIERQTEVGGELVRVVSDLR